MNQQAYLPTLLQIRTRPRLLVVTAGHVGNTIFCTPAIRLLRIALPDSTIDVVALNSASAAVFENNDAISRVHVVRWPWQMKWLASRYDQVICLHPKSVFLLADVSVPVLAMPPFDSSRHHAEQILAFVSSLVGRAIEHDDRRYHLAATRFISATLESILSRRFDSASHPRIGIHLGCGRTAIHGWKFFYRKRDQHPKLWSTDAYIALTEHLRQVFPTAVFVITGTRNERFLARRFAKTLNVIDLTGKTSIVELAGVIDALDLFITQDCGVLHVAASTSTPLLALFGPTCPLHTGPWPLASHHRILQGANMADIAPQLAADAAIEFLRDHCVASQSEAVGNHEHAAPMKKTLNKIIVALVMWMQQHHVFDWSYAASSHAGLV